MSADPASEFVAVVDEHNQVIGSCARGEMRARRLPHRATYVLVLNAAGEFFLHKRTPTKDVYPGCYDVAVGGVVLAGESYDESALRELREELGIAGVALQPHFDFYHEDPGNRVWGRVYSCVWDGPLHLQAEEIESGSFHPVEEILALAETRPFTPDGLAVLRRFLAERDSTP
jgi:8-oxo-dGTP pyrophosphatase MutT (NUDIX family)